MVTRFSLACHARGHAATSFSLLCAHCFRWMLLTALCHSERTSTLTHLSFGSAARSQQTIPMADVSATGAARKAPTCLRRCCDRHHNCPASCRCRCRTRSPSQKLCRPVREETHCADRLVVGNPMRPKLRGFPHIRVFFARFVATSSPASMIQKPNARSHQRDWHPFCAISPGSRWPHHQPRWWNPMVVQTFAHVTTTVEARRPDCSRLP